MPGSLGRLGPAAGLVRGDDPGGHSSDSGLSYAVGCLCLDGIAIPLTLGTVGLLRVTG